MQGEMLGSQRGCMRAGPLFSCEYTGTGGVSGAGASHCSKELEILNRVPILSRSRRPYLGRGYFRAWVWKKGGTYLHLV